MKVNKWKEILVTPKCEYEFEHTLYFQYEFTIALTTLFCFLVNSSIC